MAGSYNRATFTLTIYIMFPQDAQRPPEGYSVDPIIERFIGQQLGFTTNDIARRCITKLLHGPIRMQENLSYEKAIYIVFTHFIALLQDPQYGNVLHYATTFPHIRKYNCPHIFEPGEEVIAQTNVHEDTGFAMLEIVHITQGQYKAIQFYEVKDEGLHWIEPTGENLLNVIGQPNLVVTSRIHCSHPN